MSSNRRYTTPINNLPKRANNGHKRTLRAESKPVSDEVIKNKIDSMSEKELQSLYITTSILLLGMLEDFKHEQRGKLKQ